MGSTEKQAYLAKHLRYEVQMLWYAHEVVLKLKPGALRNAHIECFAVHARNLHEFLIGGKDQRNVYAKNYVTAFKAGCEQQVLIEVRHKIDDLNQQILHPGTDRPDVAELKFTAENGRFVLDWIETTLKKFNDQLQPPYDRGWFPARPQTLSLVFPKSMESGTSSSSSQSAVYY
jgi:hypothetical protein